MDEERGGITLTDTPSKGNTRLRLNLGGKLLGVASNDLSEAIATYRELRVLVRELGDLPPKVRTDYVEFRYIGWIRGQASPVQVFSSWWSGNERVAALGTYLGNHLPSDAETLSPHGIRFAPSGSEANRPNWAELLVTPLNTAGTELYHFDLLFRNEESATTESVAESADDLLDSVIRTLEET